jgi:hypothetical protein
MAYADDVPAVYNALGLRKDLLASPCNFRAVLSPDSRTDMGAAQCPWMAGVVRTWPIAWSAIAVKSTYGGSAAFLSNGFEPTTYATARGVKRPDQTLSGGHTKIAPLPILDFPFSSDVPFPAGADTAFSQVVMTQTVDYALGQQWAGLQVTARVPWYRTSSAVPSVRIRSYRNTGTDAAPVYTTVNTSGAIAMTGANAWQFTDIDCGAGSGSPGVGILENNVTETGTQMYIGPRVFYRGTPGNRVAGACMVGFGVGGAANIDFLRAMGGDGANNYCNATEVAWFLQNVGFIPNYFLHLGGGQNSLTVNNGTDTGEATQLNAGVSTIFKNTHRNICTQINTIYAANGWPIPTHVFVNDYQTGYGETHRQTRGRALFELAREFNGAFFDLFQLSSRSGAGTPWYTTDGVHMNGPAVANYVATVGSGADYMAGLLWSAIMGTGTGAYVQTFRNAGMGGG